MSISIKSLYLLLIINRSDKYERIADQQLRGAGCLSFIGWQIDTSQAEQDWIMSGVSGVFRSFIIFYCQ